MGSVWAIHPEIFVISFLNPSEHENNDKISLVHVVVENAFVRLYIRATNLSRGRQAAGTLYTALYQNVVGGMLNYTRVAYT